MQVEGQPDSDRHSSSNAAEDAESAREYAEDNQEEDGELRELPSHSRWQDLTPPSRFCRRSLSSSPDSAPQQKKARSSEAKQKSEVALESCNRWSRLSSRRTTPEKLLWFTSRRGRQPSLRRSRHDTVLLPPFVISFRPLTPVCDFIIPRMAKSWPNGAACRLVTAKVPIKLFAMVAELRVLLLARF